MLMRNYEGEGHAVRRESAGTTRTPAADWRRERWRLALTDLLEAIESCLLAAAVVGGLASITLLVIRALAR